MRLHLLVSMSIVLLLFNCGVRTNNNGSLTAYDSAENLFKVERSGYCCCVALFSFYSVQDSVDAVVQMMKKYSSAEYVEFRTQVIQGCLKARREYCEYKGIKYDPHFLLPIFDQGLIDDDPNVRKLAEENIIIYIHDAMKTTRPRTN